MQYLKNNLYRLLRKSEKYTKTDMVYLASGGFWSTLSQIITSFAIFSFAIIVARYLPKEVYGQYKYILALVAFLSTFSLTGIGASIFQSVARGFDGSLRDGFWANIRWSILMFLGAGILAIYYYILGNNMLAFGILIGGSLSPFITNTSFARVFLNAKKDFRRNSLYFGIIKILFSIGALIVTILVTHNPLILAIVYFLSNILVTFWLYRRVVHIYKPDHKKTDAGMQTYAKHLSLMGVLSGVAGKIDQILLFHFVGPVQLAIYSFAIAIPDQTKGPFKMLNTMIKAKFVNQSDTSIRGGMRNKMFWLFLSSLIFVVIYIFIAPYFYAFFFPNYTSSIIYSQIYVLSMFGLTFSPIGSYFIVKKKVREQYIGSIIISIFQIVVMVVGVVMWGLMGLVVSRVILKIVSGYFTYLLYQLFDSTKQANV